MKTTKKIILGAILALGISLSSASAEVNLGVCKGCHGANFEKKALGKSLVVKDMNATAISSALIGYKDGTYGGVMKGIMKGQVAKYSNEDLNATGVILSDVNASDVNTSK
jgi:cytochrome c-type protein NapB